MFPISSRPLGAATLALSAAALQAQTLNEVIVTGNPLGASDLIAPASQLSGPALLLRKQSTIGETLTGTPGVASSYFGPNASRPIIRGLDGDRIRVLQNGAASVDASALSFDHAVPVDPLVIERIEVLRGPAALLYGGSAVGGVVNLIDHRIHGEPLFDASGGVAGRAELRAGGADRERGGSVLLETGSDKFSLHVDAFKRRSSDTRVPIELACGKPGSPAVQRRICNSAADSDGAALGGTLLFDNGYLGLSHNTFNSVYGTVAEDEVTIDLKSRRSALQGELRRLPGPIQAIKLQASHTDYRHTELEGTDVGTLFKNRGGDLRLEARQASVQTALGALDGVLGLQLDNSRFSAEGDEAFVPFSRTRQRALFAHEELVTGWGKLSLGGRLESVRVDSLGNPDVPRFAQGRFNFSPRSLAAGALVKLSPGWDFSANLAASERAPKDYELFANGPHIATAAYELGDATLGLEKSTHLDVGLAWKSGANKFVVNAYVNRFRNFISLENTGNFRDEAGNLAAAGDPDVLPEFAYRGVRARFRGLEASGNLRLWERGDTLDLELRGDLVRAVNATTGQPLPRIAPLRLGAALAYASGPWGARLGLDHHARQNRVPAGEVASRAYTFINASVSYSVKAGPARLLWFIKLDNATDRLAASATSILTQTAPGKAPLPGRGFKAGLQAVF